MNHFSKKISLIICLLAVISMAYFGFKKAGFPKQKPEHFSDLKRDTEKIKSSCREVSIENKVKFKKISPSQRIQQLIKLMDTPIDWTFNDIHGQVIDFYCLREKKSLVINFWATWCPPCIEELPSLSLLAKNNKDKVFVVAISTEPMETIKNFLKQSFSDLSPHLKIAQISVEEKSKYFPEDSLPVTYIFDRKGLLKSKELGAKKWSEKSFIQQIINLH